MGYYIVGLLKSKTYTVEGYVILDSANNDKLSFVSKDNLVANMEENEDLIVNAKLTARGISGRSYPLTGLSSIIVTEKKRRLVDNGVLAVYSVNMKASPCGIGYRCFRLRIDPMKSDLGTATYDSLMAPGVQLINKIDGRIRTGYDANLDCRNNHIQASQPIKSVAGVERKMSNITPEKTSTQTDNNDSKLEAMLEKLRPGLEAGDRRLSHDELLKALETKMLNPYTDVSYDEFRFFMLIHGWSYKARHISADLSDGIQLYGIDPKCKILHLPSNTVTLSLNDQDDTAKPIDREFDFLYINNDTVIKLELPEPRGLRESSLRIGTLALWGEERDKNQIEIGNNYSYLKEFSIGNLIINPKIKYLKHLHTTRVGNVDLSNVAIFDCCFNNTNFDNVPKLGSCTTIVDNSFNFSNILKCQDLSELTELNYISGSFDNIEISGDTLRLTSSTIYSIHNSFNNIDNIAELDLSQCVELENIQKSFNNCKLIKVELPIVGEATLTDTYTRVDFKLNDSFSSILCSKLRLPLNTILLERCLKDTTQDITIEIHPFTGKYDPSKRVSTNVGIKYLCGRKSNFKFTVDNFDIPYGFVTIKNGELPAVYYNNEEELAELRRMSVRDVVPRNSIFSEMALSNVPFKLFDTADFSLISVIGNRMFGGSKINSNACKIDTIVINNNIKEVKEEAFAGISNVKHLYISPKIKQIDPKAFNKNRVVSVCNVYTTEESPVYKMLKNKKGFNVILVGDFDEAVAEMRDALSNSAEAPAKFKMMINSNPLYKALLGPEYSANIQKVYTYLRRLETGLSEQMLSELPQLNTAGWSEPQYRTKYIDNELLQVIVETQYLCTKDVNDSPQAMSIFNGLNNMLTAVMGNSEPELTRKDTLEKLRYFYSTAISLDISGDYGIDPDEWSSYMKTRTNELNNIRKLVREAQGNMNDPAVVAVRRDFIAKYINSPYPVDKMVDLILDLDVNCEYKMTWDKANSSLISKVSGLGVRFLYFDKNKNAIFTMTVDGNRVEPENFGCRLSTEVFDILIIMYEGEVVWARPLLMCHNYKNRFNVNYNNLNRYNHSCTFTIQEGDLITSGDTSTIGGIELKNSVLNPIILKAADVLSCGEIQKISEMPQYSASRDESYNSILRLFKCALFPISGKTKSGKFYIQLFYDVLMQKFYEIESYNSGCRDDSLGKHMCHGSYSSMRIVKIWNLSEIEYIPQDYFEILRLDENSSRKDYSADTYSSAMYTKFKLSSGNFNINKVMLDESLYLRNNEERSALLSIADQLADKIDKFTPTVKLFNAIERTGLMASFRAKPSAFCHKTCFTTLNNIGINDDVTLRELKLRDTFYTRRSPESLIDTGHIRNSSQKILISGELDTVLFSNYTYYHDTPGRYSDKIRTFYTSLQSLENIIKLIKLIGSSRANGLRGIGGLSNDPNKAVVTSNQIVPFYFASDMRFVYDTVQNKAIDVSRRYDYVDPNTCIEYKVGIGVDLGDGEIYSIAVCDNMVIVLFRHDSLKAAALFQSLTMTNTGWASAAYAISHNLGVDIGRDLMVLREMIIQGYNSEIPFVSSMISQLTGADTALAQSAERRFNSRLINLITKQMRQ